ncbi:MAG: hypothetical protein ACTSXT_00315 [Candidatus Helarchaeota archaeon]
MKKGVIKMSRLTGSNRSKNKYNKFIKVLLLLIIVSFILPIFIQFYNSNSFLLNHNNSKPKDNNFNNMNLLEDHPFMREDFESQYLNSTKWDSHWTKSPISFDSSDPYEGDYCAKIENDNSWYHLFWNTTSPPISISEYPIFRFALKAPRGTRVALVIYLDTHWYALATSPHGNKTYYLHSYVIPYLPNYLTIIDDNDWHLYEYDLSQTGYSNISYFGFFSDNWSANENEPVKSYWVDDIALSKTRTPVEPLTSSWYDLDYDYRLNINITEPNIKQRIKEPIDIFLTFPNGHAYNNSIIATYYLNGKFRVIPSQVWNLTFYSGTSYIESCTITILADLLKGQTRRYYIYYASENVNSKEYSSLKLVEIDKNRFNINTPVYNISLNATSGYINRGYFNYFSELQSILSTSYCGIITDFADGWQQERFHSANIQITQKGPVFINITVSKTIDHGTYSHQLTKRFLFYPNFIKIKVSVQTGTTSPNRIVFSRINLDSGVLSAYYKDQYGNDLLVDGAGTNDGIFNSWPSSTPGEWFSEFINSSNPWGYSSVLLGGVGTDIEYWDSGQEHGHAGFSIAASANSYYWNEIAFVPHGYIIENDSFGQIDSKLFMHPITFSLGSESFRPSRGANIGEPIDVFEHGDSYKVSTVGISSSLPTYSYIEIPNKWDSGYLKTEISDLIENTSQLPNDFWESGNLGEDIIWSTGSGSSGPSSVGPTNWAYVWGDYYGSYAEGKIFGFKDYDNNGDNDLRVGIHADNRVYEHDTYARWYTTQTLTYGEITGALLIINYSARGWQYSHAQINITLNRHTLWTRSFATFPGTYPIIEHGDWYYERIGIPINYFPSTGTAFNFSVSVETTIDGITGGNSGEAESTNVTFSLIRLFIQRKVKPSDVGLKMNVINDDHGTYILQDDPHGQNGISKAFIVPCENWRGPDINSYILRTFFYTTIPHFRLTPNNPPITFQVKQTFYGTSIKKTTHTYGSPEPGTTFQTNNSGNTVWNFNIYTSQPPVQSPQSDIKDYTFYFNYPLDWDIKELWTPQSPPVNELSSTNKVIRQRGTGNLPSGNAWWYQDIIHPFYETQPGDYLYYDIKFPTSSQTQVAGIDLEFPSNNLRDSGATDQNGIIAHPAANLAAYANNKWYHRQIKIPDARIGLNITSVEIALEHNSLTTEVYYRNIYIGDAEGNVRFPIYWSGSYNFATERYGPGNNQYINTIYDTIIDSNGTSANFKTLEIPTDIANIFGYWKVSAESPNYVLDAELRDGNTLALKNSYRVGDIMRVNASIRADPFGNYKGKAMLSIYTPTDQLWYSEYKTVPNGGQVVFSNIAFGGLNTSAGTYKAVINYNDSTSTQGATEAGVKILYFNITHSTSITRVLPTDQLLTEFEGDSAIFKIQYLDSNKNEGIANANITFKAKGWDSGVDHIGQMVYVENGIYVGELNTTGRLGNYYVDIHCEKDFYDSIDQNNYFRILVIKDTSLSYDSLPSIPYGENTSVTVYYLNKSGLGVLNADFNLNITFGSPQYNSGTNSYTINIRTDNLLEGRYTIQLNASKLYHENLTIYIPITIRAIKTSVSYEAPSPVPFGQNLTFISSFIIDDALSSNNGNGIDSIDDLTINESGTISYSWISIGNGQYSINVSTYNWDIGQYTLNITLYKAHYYNKSILFSFNIRVHNTEITYNSPEPVPWSRNTSVIITFKDLDLNSQPITAPIDRIIANGTNIPYISLGNGQYNITLNTASLGVGRYTYNVVIYAKNYDNNTNNYVAINIRTHKTLFLYDSPEITPFLNNITIQFYYLDDDTGQAGIANNSNLGLICRIVSPTVFVPNYWVIEQAQAGTYKLYISTTNFPEVNIYTIELNLTWNKDSEYQNQSKKIQATVGSDVANGIGRLTDLTYDTPQSVPMGDNVSIDIYYIDIDDPNQSGISNTSSNVRITMSIISPSTTCTYWIYDLNSQTLGKYRILIDSLSLPSNGTYTMRVYINWSHNSPYYQNQSKDINFIVRFNNTLLTYSPPGTIAWSNITTANITINYWDIDHDVGIAGAVINLTLVHPSNYKLVYNVNWTYSYVGSGDYVIEIKMENLTEQTYTFMITANKSYFVYRKLENINMTIRSRYTLINSPEYPAATIPLGLYNITIYYLDKESGQYLINSSDIVFEFFTYDSNSTWRDQLLGNSTIANATLFFDANEKCWLIQINMTKFNLDLTYNITINISKTHYQTQTINISLSLEKRATVMGVITPESHVWGENVTFTVIYTDLSGDYIPNVVITINWTKQNINYYKVIDEGDGNYTIELNTTAKQARNYYLEINASAVNYMLRSRVILLLIRPIDSSVEYVPPSTTAWGNNLTITLEYRDLIHNNLINGSQISISTNVSNGYWNWYYNPNKAGSFILEIDTKFHSFLLSDNYVVNIHVNWSGIPYYQNQTFNVLIFTRHRNTEIAFQPPETVYYGANSTFTVQYNDLDNSSIGIENQSNPWGSYLKIYVFFTNGTLFAPLSDNGWVNELGSGYYQIILNTSKLPNIGTYNFIIRVNWSNVAPFYSNNSIQVSVMVRSRNTEILYSPPLATGFGLNSTLSITYWDVENSIGISDPNNQVNITIWDSYGRMWNDSGYAWVSSQGNGSYLILINTSKLNYLGEYNFTVWANWTGKPFYENSSRAIKIRVRNRLTELPYNPPLTTPYSDKVNFSVYFNDVDINEGIDNSTHNVFFSIENVTLYRIYNMQSITPGMYYIEINTSDPVLGIGYHTLYINVTTYGKPYYTNRSITVGLNVREIDTELNAIYYVNSIPYNDNLTITLSYNDSDHNGIGIPVSSQNVSCNWPLGFKFINIGSGIFNIELNTSVTEQKWSTWIYVDKENYKSANITITFTVRNIYTDYQTNASFISNWPWNENITIEIGYLDIDHNINVSGLSLSNIAISSEAPWNNGQNYSLYFDSNTNKYYLTLNTSYVSESKTYSIYVNLFQTHYANQSFVINISFRYPSASVFILDVSPSTTIAWGDNLTILLTLNDTITLEPINGTIWLTPTSTFPSDNYTVYQIKTGVYRIELNTTWEKRPEDTYILTVQSSAPNYHNASSAVVITIRKIDTLLEITSSPPYINFEGNGTIQFQFNDTELGHTNTGLNHSILNVYWKDNSGVLHAWDGPDVNGSYTVYENISSGLYTIEINSSSALGIGEWTIYINASLNSAYWGNKAHHYKMGETTFTLRITEIETTFTPVSFPSSNIPWGQIFNITVRYNNTQKNCGISGATINIDNWGIIHSNWDYLYLGNGLYKISINSSIINGSQLEQLLSVSIHINKSNYVSKTTTVFVTIRKIETRIDYVPPDITPINNTALLNFTFTDIDNSLPITNSTGRIRITCNITGWPQMTYKVYDFGNGLYSVEIDTSNLPYVNYSYPININITHSQRPYYTNQSFTMNLMVRSISTLLIINPLNSQPLGNDVNISLQYIISDSESIFDGTPINNASIEISKNYSFYSILNIGNGKYILTINSSDLTHIGRYSLWISVNKTRYSSSNKTFSFNVRSRITNLIHIPFQSIPFANIANISFQYLDVDNSNQPILNSSGYVRFYILNGTQILSNSFVWTQAKGNYYYVYINTTKLNSLGVFNFTVWANWTENSRYYNASDLITITLKQRNTAFTNEPIGIIYHGQTLTFSIFYKDLDNSSYGITNSSWGSGNVHISALIDNNLTETRYTIIEIGNGEYQISFNSSLILQNIIGIHQVQINVSWTGIPFFKNKSLSDTFTIRKIYTNYKVIIGGINTQDYTGWQWGRNATFWVYYNNSDQHKLVYNSHIIVTGEGPYNTNNIKIMTFLNGSFYIELNGTVPEHDVKYRFYITLYKDEKYINQSFTITITFFKNFSNIFFKSISHTITWGDNGTIIFSYNDTESAGQPGIPNAQIIVSVDQIEANSSYNVYELGNGVYKITMNSTWAPNQLILVKFNIYAVRREFLPVNTSCTIQIKPISTELRMVNFNYTIWKDAYVGANNFNITVKLLDLDHENLLIVNNSKPRYENVTFYIKWNSQMSNKNWEYGNFSAFGNDTDPSLQGGYYKLNFFWNPDTPELINYQLNIYVNGSHLSLSFLQVQFNLKIHNHYTNMTLDWNYTRDVLGLNIPYFETFDPNKIYYYGDIINVTFFWYDLNASNSGIAPGNHYLTCNWSTGYYIPKALYYEYGYNVSYYGIYQIQIDTLLIGKNMIKPWTINISIYKQEFEISYLMSFRIITFNITSIPTNLSLNNPIPITPWSDYIIINTSYLDLYRNIGVVKPDNIEVTTWLPGTYFVEYYGGSTYIFSLFTKDIVDVGTHRVNILIEKLNYDTINVTFYATVRNISTSIDSSHVYYRNMTYREIQEIRFSYIDLDHHNEIITNPSTIGTNWSGLVTLLPYTGIARIIINASIDIGTYNVLLWASSNHYDTAYYVIRITISPMPTHFDLIVPPPVEFYQGKTITITLHFNNSVSEDIKNAHVWIEIYSPKGELVINQTFTYLKNGIYTVQINTFSCWMNDVYTIKIVAAPQNKNYARSEVVYSEYMLIKSIFIHPFAIILYIAAGIVAAVFVYRQIKWYLLPDVLKKIIVNTKAIKKRKAGIKTPVVRNRQEMFKDEFGKFWHYLGLSLEPLKVTSPEVISFASEISGALRTRITTPEAEKIINYLKSLESQLEAENYLQSLGVPPAATKRLLEIIGIIKKEKVEILEFAKALSEIKGTPLDYSQAEEIMKTLLSSPSDADSYLKAMIIPEEDRYRLLKMIGIEKKPRKKQKGKSIPKKDKLKQTKKEKIPSTTPKTPQKESFEPETPSNSTQISGKPSDHLPMTEVEIEIALNEIPNLSESDKAEILKYLKTLSYEEQKKFLDNLLGNQ